MDVNLKAVKRLAVLNCSGHIAFSRAKCEQFESSYICLANMLGVSLLNLVGWNSSDETQYRLFVMKKRKFSIGNREHFESFGFSSLSQELIRLV